MNIPALAGGVLIGLAAAILLIFNGRIMGASGIASVFTSLIPEAFKATILKNNEFLWRGIFLTGLLLGGLIFFGIFSTAPTETTLETPPSVLAISGLLVGIGTRLGLGCTSGHGICGMGRLSGRSLIATVIFITSGIIAATFIR